MSLYQKIIVGHSWVETRFWQDHSGRGQDLYCTLCDRWYSRHHEQGGRHLQRCASRGFRPWSDEEEAEQASPREVRGIMGTDPQSQRHEPPITAEEIWYAPIRSTSTHQAAMTSHESQSLADGNRTLALASATSTLPQDRTGSQYIESICVSVSDTLFLDNHDSSLCCGGWEHARSRKRDPVYHSPQEVRRKLSGRGLMLPPLLLI